MKKASIFILIVMFLVSIFVINFYGLSIRTDHMKQYIHKLEITHLSLASDGTRLDYEWVGKGENKRKVVKIDISERERPFGLYIEYIINPEEGDFYDFLEFAIDSDVGTYQEKDEYGNPFGPAYPRAEISSSTGVINRNLVTIYEECTFRVALRATDGSGQSDTINIWCLNLSTSA